MKQKNLAVVIIVLLMLNAGILFGNRYKVSKDYSKDYREYCQKDYEAACLQADFIRYLIDPFDGEMACSNIGSEIEECYYEYFTDIEGYGTSIKDVKELEQYYWCY